MSGFPLQFNSHVYLNEDFSTNNGYRDVYPELLTDMPLNSDLSSLGLGVSNLGIWSDTVNVTIFPEPCDISIKMSCHKFFFPGQMIRFQDFQNLSRTGTVETSFDLRVKTYNAETGELFGRIEAIEGPRSASKWVAQVIGSEISYNSTKSIALIGGGTAGTEMLSARSALFMPNPTVGIAEVFEDFTGFGDAGYQNLSAGNVTENSSGGSTKFDGEGPMATIGNNWLGVAKLTIGTSASARAGVHLNNTFNSTYGLVTAAFAYPIEIIARVYIPVLGAGGDDYKIVFGLFRGDTSVLVPTPEINGGYTLCYKFATNANHWVARKGVTGTITTSNTAVSPAVGWNILRIAYDPGTNNVTFYANGATLTSIAMTALDAMFSGATINDALKPSLFFFSDSTNTTSKSFYLDYMFVRAKILR